MSDYLIVNYNCSVLEGNNYKLKWDMKEVTGADPKKLKKKLRFEELEFN